MFYTPQGHADIVDMLIGAGCNLDIADKVSMILMSFLFPPFYLKGFTHLTSPLPTPQRCSQVGERYKHHIISMFPVPLAYRWQHICYLYRRNPRLMVSRRLELCFPNLSPRGFRVSIKEDVGIGCLTVAFRVFRACCPIKLQF